NSRRQGQMIMSSINSATDWAWQTSLAALPLIILAFAATLILRKPIFTPIRHMLGLLVIARLLLPITPSSPFSVQNLLSIEKSIPTGTAPSLTPVEPSISLESLPPPSPPPATRPQFEFRTMLPLIWAAGTLTLLIHVLRQHFQVRRWIASDR